MGLFERYARVSRRIRIMTMTDRVDEFVTLFTQHSLRLYAYVRMLVPHQADAEDIFQEASRFLWEQFDTYRTDSDFMAWACHVSRFKVWEHRRKRARQPAELSDTVYELLDEEAWQSMSSLDVQMRALAGCFNKLPVSDREIVDARYQEGATPKALAQSFGRSLDAIYRTLRRIHKSLFECIQRTLAEEGDL